MEIVYLGHSAFKIRSKLLTVITDPFDPEMVGLKWVKQGADVVTVSHSHNDHAYLEGIKPREQDRLVVIDGPGEYEIKDVSVEGWQTYHDATKGSERGKNTIYKFEIEGVQIVHLGDLGHELSDSLLEEMGGVDVLMVPVGGVYSLSASQAASVVGKVEPRIVIPMHYLMEGMNSELFGQLAPVETFMKEMGLDGISPLDKLSVSADKLPLEMQVVVMK